VALPDEGQPGYFWLSRRIQAPTATLNIGRARAPSGIGNAFVLWPQPS